MPPRLHLFSARRAITYRSPQWARGSDAVTSLRFIVPCRTITADEKPLPTTDEPKGPNQDQLPHVSEEAAATGKITGDGGPELEQGTPVQEILERDSEGQKKAPQVVKKAMNQELPKGARSFSTSARRSQDAMAQVAMPQVLPPGLKFEMPPITMPRSDKIRERYDPVVDQVTKMIMRDGKKSMAQRNMSLILNHLRTAPPPSPSGKYSLLPSAPPPNELPLNPVLYLTLAIDSIAPLLRIRNQRGAAGGGMALQIPVPLGIKQRRRTAVKWILDSAEKKPSGGGKGALAKKIADEIVSVIEGRSSIWEKRSQVHRLGVGSRVNAKWSSMRRR